MNKSEVLTGFNNHLTEMIDALLEVLPNNKELKAASVSIGTLRRANPKIIIPIWKTYVLDKYEENIMGGNIEYFLEKDYTEDVKDTGNATTILEKINIVKNTMKELDKENIDKTILYLQNLTKLCKVYYL
jgi:hypothetical protein